VRRLFVGRKVGEARPTFLTSEVGESEGGNSLPNLRWIGRVIIYWVSELLMVVALVVRVWHKDCVFSVGVQWRV